MIQIRTEPSGQGKRSDLIALRDAIKEGKTTEELWEDYFPQMVKFSKGIKEARLSYAPKRSWKTRVTVIYGKSGTGKSYLAKTMAPGAYWQEQGKWWDDYDQEASVIIDDFNYGWLPWTMLKRICDENPMKAEVKGSFVNFAPRSVIFTCSVPPHMWYSKEAIKGDFLEMQRRIDELIIMEADVVGKIAQHIVKETEDPWFDKYWTAHFAEMSISNN